MSYISTIIRENGKKYGHPDCCTEELIKIPYYIKERSEPSLYNGVTKIMYCKNRLIPCSKHMNLLIKEIITPSDLISK